MRNSRIENDTEVDTVTSVGSAQGCSDSTKEKCAETGLTQNCGLSEYCEKKIIENVTVGGRSAGGNESDLSVTFDPVKNENQIEAILKAAEIIDDTYDYVLSLVKEGVSEIELAEAIKERVLSLGGSGVSFDTIVAFGENGAEPHHVPTDKKLEKGVLVTVDMGAVYNGMCSDFTRTFAFGTPSDKQREIYEIVYRSQKLALAAVKTGVSCKDIDTVAREYISDAGYGEFYVHGTGHGVGELIHEPPTLNAKSEEFLEKDTVVTIEPGIYIPDELGVRIEDMIIVGINEPVSRHGTELIVIA